MEQTIHNLQRDKNTLIQTLEQAGLSPGSQQTQQRGIPPVPTTKQRQFSAGNGRSKDQQDSHQPSRGNYAGGGQTSGNASSGSVLSMQNMQQQVSNQNSS